MTPARLARATALALSIAVLLCPMAFAQTAPANLCVVVFDNEGYVSTGRWPSTASLTAGPVDLEAVANGSGIARACTVRSVDELVAAVEATRAAIK